MSCNSCSNVTLPGVVGPAGPAGSNGSNGADGDHIVVLKVYKRASSTPAQPGASSYDFSTLTLTPPAGWSTSVPAGTDPCYVSHGTASVTPPATVDSSITWTNPPEIAFENGADGITLLHTLTSASSDITSATYTTAISGGPWQVYGGTLNTNGDTLRLQAQTMVTPGFILDVGHGIQVLVGSTNPPTVPLEISFPAVPDYLNGFYYFGNYSYILEVDMVRVSDTSIRMESKLSSIVMDTNNSDYANEIVKQSSAGQSQVGVEVTNSSQVITVSDLDTDPFYVDINLKTFNSVPTKLLYAKLYWLNKLVNT